MTIGRSILAVLATAALAAGALAQPATPAVPTVVTAAPVASAAATRPEAAPTTQAPNNANDIERRPIGGTARDGTRSDGGSIGGWVGPSWWALLVVLALVFGAAWVFKRLGPNAVRNRPGSLFRTLSRWHLSARQYVTLVQVGRRVLLLGVTSQQINLLAEVTDPAEIEHLLSNSAAGRSILAEGFGQLFGRQREQMAVAGGETAADSAGRAVSQLGETIEKIKSRMSRGG